jgi:hypothetical protein
VTSRSRLLPWHDTPRCRETRNGQACGGPIVVCLETTATRCGACGAGFNPTVEEREQIRRAEAALDRVLAGEVHEDKACARCGGCLPVEQFRLCHGCVEADNAERHGRLL